MITSREFTELAAFLELEPDLGTRLDWLAASITARAGLRARNEYGRLIEWGQPNG